MYNRSAFTMIELIFIIVIIGILATVAIPKLAATKDDAKDSRLCKNIAVCVSDMGAVYTSKQHASLSESESCSQTDVQPHVSLGSDGHSISVSGAPAICAHLNRTFVFGGTRISL